MRVLLTTDGPVAPLIRYFVVRRVSRALQRNVALALGLLIDFFAAHGELLDDSRKRHFAFAVFAQTLHGGTIGPDGHDESGLFWPALSKMRTVALVEALCGFADWLAQEYDSEPVGTSRTALNWFEKVALQRRADARTARSLLSHTHSQSSPQNAVFRPGLERLPVGPLVRPPSFPEDQIANLLVRGFGMPADPACWNDLNWNVRDAALTALLHGSGVRVSQAMHLWLDDVWEDSRKPGHAIVRIYHPSDGLAPPRLSALTNRPVRMRRGEYLRTFHSMDPRNEALGTAWAGWKEPALDDPRREAFLPVFFFPTWWGAVFWRLWKTYVQMVRPKTASHPLAWVALHPAYSGLPLTIGSYTDTKRAAVERSGLIFAKEEGTTHHGHRHAFGRRLEGARVSRQIIQRCMHHKSIFSQLPYTAPAIAEISYQLNEAQAVISEGRQDKHSRYQGEFQTPFSDVDPFGLFA